MPTTRLAKIERVETDGLFGLIVEPQERRDALGLKTGGAGRSAEAGRLQAHTRMIEAGCPGWRGMSLARAVAYRRPGTQARADPESRAELHALFTSEGRILRGRCACRHRRYCRRASRQQPCIDRWPRLRPCLRADRSPARPDRRIGQVAHLRAASPIGRIWSSGALGSVGEELNVSHPTARVLMAGLDHRKKPKPSGRSNIGVPS